jgi:hypothetical protein
MLLIPSFRVQIFTFIRCNSFYQSIVDCRGYNCKVLPFLCCYIITVPVLVKLLYNFACMRVAAMLLVIECSLHRIGNDEYFASSACRCQLRIVVPDKCKILKIILHPSHTVYLMWNERVARHLVINSIHSAIPIGK